MTKLKKNIFTDISTHQNTRTKQNAFAHYSIVTKHVLQKSKFEFPHNVQDRQLLKKKRICER